MTTKNLLEKLDFKKGNGLIPVVVQDAKPKKYSCKHTRTEKPSRTRSKRAKQHIGAAAETNSGSKAKPQDTPKKSFPFQPTATMTHYSMWLSRQAPHATQANTAASSTKCCKFFDLI